MQGFREDSHDFVQQYQQMHDALLCEYSDTECTQKKVGKKRRNNYLSLSLSVVYIVV